MLPQFRISVTVPQCREFADWLFRQRFIDCLHFNDPHEDFIPHVQGPVSPDEMIFQRQRISADFDITNGFVQKCAAVSRPTDPPDDSEQNPQVADTSGGDFASVDEDFECDHPPAPYNLTMLGELISKPL